VSDKLQLIYIDGPIEPNWVENLNSVLDDNRKLCFGAGDSLGLTDKMKIILETSDLRYCSPATISRCAIVYMEEADEMIPVKAHINKWICTLPGILVSEIDRLDMVINYFLIHIRDNYLEPHMQVHKVSKKQAMRTFTNIMESQLQDYRNEKYTRWKEVLRGYQTADKKLDWGDFELEDTVLNTGEDEASDH